MLAATRNGNNLLVELDARYVPLVFLIARSRTDVLVRFRQVPIFGDGTIRRFSSNVSSMSRVTAATFEDILQVRPFLLSHRAGVD